MARPKIEGKTTMFGLVIDEMHLDYETVAKELGITSGFVGMLARGDATPALALSFEIVDWAKKRGYAVPIESWRKFCKKWKKSKKKR
jgi:hypothetical protein